MDRNFKAGLIALFLFIVSFNCYARVIRSGPGDLLDFQTDGVNSRAEIKSDGTFEIKNRLQVETTGDLSRPYTTLTEAERDLLTPVAGDITFNETSGFLNFFNTVWRVLVDSDSSQTLTNKTLDANSNTFSNFEHGAEVDNPSSGVHGVTGSVVGTTDAQDLSNKTFIDPITVEELVSTPANPAAGDKKIYCKTDDKCYQLNSAGVETELGAGGGGGAVSVEDEGVELTTGVTKFNFVGAGVTVTEPVADEMEVTIPLAAGVTETAKKQSVEYREGNGQGSTDTGIRRFLTLESATGSGVFAAVNTAANGLTLTFLVDACGTVTYQDIESGGGGSTYGLGINSSDLTSDWANIPYASRLAGMSVTGSSITSHVNHGGTAWSGCVSTGDVIRPHGASADDSNSFGITRFSAQFTEKESVVLTTIDNDPPASRGSSVATAMATGLVYFLDFDSQNHDSALGFTGCGSGHTTTAGTGCRWIAPRDGVVSIKSHIRTEDDNDWGGGEQGQLRIYKNTVLQRLSFYENPTTANTTNHIISMQVSADVEVSEGDTIQIAFTQNTGGSILLKNNADNNWFDVHYVDAKSLLSQIDLGTVIAPFVADITRRTDLESFSPTYSNGGGFTWTQENAQKGRDGEYLILHYDLETSTNGTDAGNFEFILPDNLEISSKFYRNGRCSLGSGTLFQSGAGTSAPTSINLKCGSSADRFFLEENTSGGSTLSSLTGLDIDANDRISFSVRIPIEGWGADSTVVITPLEKDQPAKRSGLDGGSIANATWTFVDYDNQTYDEDGNFTGCGAGHVTVSGTGCRWVAPRPGKVKVCASFQFNGSTDWGEQEFTQLSVWKNGVQDSRLDLNQKESAATLNYTMFAGGCHDVEIAKDDYLEIGIFQNSGNPRIPSSALSESQVSINYVDSKSLLSGLEENNTRLLVTMSAAHGVIGTADVQFDTIAKQTGAGSYDTGTYTYTVGETGSYNICVGVRWEHGNTPSAGELLRTFINLNGSNTAIARYAFPASPGGGAQLFFPGCKNYELVEGDTVKIQMAESVTPPVNADPTGSFFQIVKNSSLTIGGNVEPEKFQNKFLSADETTSGATMSDLTFSNLEIGKCYEYNAQIAIGTNTGGTPGVNIRHNGANINQVFIQGSSGTQATTKSTSSQSFIASGTSLEFQTNNLAAGRAIFGDGGVNETWVQLKEKTNGCVETNQW